MNPHKLIKKFSSISPFIKPSEIFYHLVLIILLAFLAFTPFVYNRSLMFGTISMKMFWCWAVSTGILITSLLPILRKDKQHVILSWPDLMVITIFAFIVISNLLSGKSGFVTHNILSFSIFFLLYISFRIIMVSVNHQRYLAHIFVFFLLVSGIGQAIYGLLQLYGFLPSFHQNFRITGTFFNPAPYSGYLAITGILGVSCWFLLKEKSKTSLVLRYTGLITILSVLLILPAAESRASWLALSGGSLVVLWIKYKSQINLSYICNSNIKKISAILFIMLIIMAGIYGLYVLKPGSVQGRQLVWKVSSKMISNNPITGVGLGRFGAEYGNYQAQYFANKDAPQWQQQVAGYEHYAFNEFIQICCETGVIGLLLVISLLTMIYLRFTRMSRHGYHNEESMLYYAATAGLTGILIFALFSYPMSVSPIMIAGVFFLSLLAGSHKAVVHYNFPRLGLIAMLAGLIAGMFFLVPYLQGQYKAYQTWKQGYSMYSMGDYKLANANYTIVIDKLKDNGVFLTHYGKALTMEKQWQEALQILNRAKTWSSDPVIYTSLGDCHKALKQYGKAEQAYLHASNITPGRFYPLYLLAKLYDDSNQPIKAKQTARKVMQKDIKIPSTAIKEIKQEMEIIITGNKLMNLE